MYRKYSDFVEGHQMYTYSIRNAVGFHVGIELVFLKFIVRI